MSTHRSSTSRNPRPPEYGPWHDMIRRCYDSRRKNYRHYGGRGIKVCDRWRQSFEAFLEDMGPRPSPKHSIDRYPNNDGNYEPDNCRWATQGEQLRNYSRTRHVTYNGRTQCIADWAVEMKLPAQTLYTRIREGWDAARALTTPAPGRVGKTAADRRVLITYNGVTQTVTEWARHLGVPHATLSNRIKHGWTVEDAMTVPFGGRSAVNATRSIRSRKPTS